MEQETNNMRCTLYKLLFTHKLKFLEFGFFAQSKMLATQSTFVVVIKCGCLNSSKNKERLLSNVLKFFRGFHSYSRLLDVKNYVSGLYVGVIDVYNLQLKIGQPL